MPDEKLVLQMLKYELLKALNNDLYYPEQYAKNGIIRVLLLAELESVNKRLEALADGEPSQAAEEPNTISAK